MSPFIKRRSTLHGMKLTLLHGVMSLLVSCVVASPVIAAPEPLQEEKPARGTEAPSKPSQVPSGPETALPAEQLPQKQVESAQDKAVAGEPCRYLITVADDFIVAAYKNGTAIPLEKRELLLDTWKSFSEVENGKNTFHVVR
jgi:hypothetical protein